MQAETDENGMLLTLRATVGDKDSLKTVTVTRKGDKFVGPDFTKSYHTYAVDWQPNEIVWYVDGVERFHVTENVPSVPMYILANLAVGGDWPGNPDATTPFPSYMDIDYIRVYQK